MQAHFLDPAERDGSVTVGMRWEATGVTGWLFPALDANITLTAEGDQATAVTLTGVYRSPLGALGAGLDRALLHHLATATVSSLLTRMGKALEGTEPSAGGRAVHCGGSLGRRQLSDPDKRRPRPCPPGWR